MTKIVTSRGMVAVAIMTAEARFKRRYLMKNVDEREL